MNDILNEKEFYKNLREVISTQLLERARDLNLIDDVTIRKVIKELSKVEVMNYAS